MRQLCNGSRYEVTHRFALLAFVVIGDRLQFAQCIDRFTWLAQKIGDSLVRLLQLLFLILCKPLRLISSIPSFGYILQFLGNKPRHAKY